MRFRLVPLATLMLIVAPALANHESLFPNAAPTVTITAPAENATVSGTVAVQGTSDDPDDDNWTVEVSVDQGPWENATGNATWTFSWDTTALPDGRHNVSARAFDGGEYSDIVVRNVNVTNDGGGNATRPGVTISQPTEGAVLSGAVNVTGTAAPASGGEDIERVDVRIDTGAWQPATGNASWSFEWNTTSVPDGAHNVSARAWDGTAYSGVAGRNVTVSNGATSNAPPSISITQPAAGARLSGPVTIRGSATDPDDDPVTVEVRVAGSFEWAAATGADPWSYEWSTTGLADGNHTIDARARDPQGATATVNRTIVLERQNVTTPDVEVRIVAPAEGSTVAPPVNISLDATARTGNVTRVEVGVDGVFEDAEATHHAGARWFYKWNATGLPDRLYTIHARAFAGNASSDDMVRTVILRSLGGALDRNRSAGANVAPVLTLQAPTQDQPVSGSVVLAGIATDANPDDAALVIESRLDTGTWQRNASVSGAPFRFEMGIGAIAPGLHRFEARAYDGEAYSAIVAVNVQASDENLSQTADGDDEGFGEQLTPGPTALAAIAAATAVAMLLRRRRAE